MIFSIVILLIVLGLTYIHYLQGAFTSAISMGCALAATLVAFGYYETVVNQMAQSGFADYAGGMSLIVLFAVTYIVLRTLADMFVPGNIALQLYVEKTVAVLCGGVAAMLAAGTFAVGLQLMPFTASVAGYSPYELRERDVRVPAGLVGRQRGTDSFVFDETASDKLDGPPSSLLLPADAFVLSLVKLTSDGSFAGGQSFAAVHPDLSTEGFRSRVGGEHSGKHVVFNTSKQTNATFEGLYSLPGTPTFLDTEVLEIRPSNANLAYKLAASDKLVVVRLGFGEAAADKDGVVRLTPAAARLVIDGQTFYPIGTMQGADYVGINRIDDLIPVGPNNGGRQVDLVYALPKALADSLNKPETDDSKLRFIEVKLFGRIDLTDKKLAPYPGPTKQGRVIRKPTSPLGAATKTTPATP